MILSENKLHKILKESIKKVILEDYGKWFQTEENGIKELYAMIVDAQHNLDKIDELSPEEVWELVRKIGYINHSAFKVKPGKWDLYPDEELNRNDKLINDIVYKFKTHALKIINDYYRRHGLDISTTDKRNIVLLRNPVNGKRQITFHTGKDDTLTKDIERENGTWDGVRQAHHYTNDDDYEKERLRYLNSRK